MSPPLHAQTWTIAAHEVIVAVFQQHYWRSFRIQFNVLLFLGGSVVGSIVTLKDRDGVGILFDAATLRRFKLAKDWGAYSPFPDLFRTEAAFRVVYSS